MKTTFYSRWPTVFLLIYFSVINPLFAQDQEKQESLYGIKAGINFAELWGKDALPESDRKVGYSFGGYASYHISKHLKFQPEVIWSLQGENSKKAGDIRYLM